MKNLSEFINILVTFYVRINTTYTKRKSQRGINLTENYQQELLPRLNMTLPLYVCKN